MQASRTRSPASCRGIIAVGFELLLGSVNIAATGGTAWFWWRAEKEVPRAEAALKAAGYTMDVTALAAADVPDEDNAGAIAPLLGLSTREQDETPEIKERRIRLSLLSFRPPRDLPEGAVRDAAKLLAGGILDPKALKDLPNRRNPPEITADKPINWTEWVEWFQLLGWPTPGTEITDAGVVYRTLALRTDFLAAPLSEAAGRRFASLTPSQLSRFNGSIARKDIVLELDFGKSRFIPALRALALQMEAALASGKDKEAADLVPVFFRLRDVVTADGFLIDLLVRQTADIVPLDILKRNLTAGKASALWLEALQHALVSRPSLAGLERTFNLEAAFGCYMMQQVMEQRVSLDGITQFFGDPNEHRGKLRWYEEPLASSLFALNRAERIRMFLEDMDAWKAGGPMGYYHVAKAREERAAANDGWAVILRPDRMIAEGAGGYSSLIPKFLHRDMRRRMAITTCALERHRCATGAVPEKLADLPHELLAEVPADLDGQPIRYRRHDDGWVLWSVGMDLKDDLRGAAPAPDKMEDHQRADWQWRNRSGEWQ